MIKEEQSNEPAERKIQLQKKPEKNKNLSKKLSSWYDNADVKILLSISDSTLARRRKKREIPYTKLGNKYYYPRAFFEETMMAQLQNKHLLDPQ